MHHTQTGYIPGTQITDNCRLIEEIIEHINLNNEEGYLITLDAQKAFDSVDHNYLLKILQIYGFPPIYISWVKTLYNNLRSCVQVNGFSGELFKVERSVKQGDALSCALFIIAIDPLLRQIDKDPRIENIVLKIKDDNYTCPKSATFADDITAIFRNKEAINIIIEHYNNFTEYSGIKLNIPKTEIMKLGPSHTNKQQHEITDIDNTYIIGEVEAVKICGITFSNNKIIAYKENIIKKIDKLSKQLNIWKQRNLTLQGKIIIVKTFGLSQMIYSLQTTHIEQKELKEIDDHIYRFIWNTKSTSSKVTPKIKKNILKSNFANGGLNAPDIYSINDAIKYKQLIKCHHSKHPLAYLIQKSLNALNYSINRKLINGIGKLSQYYQRAIKIHNKLIDTINTDIQNLVVDIDNIKIHKMYYAYVINHQLNKSHFLNSMQNVLIKNLTKNKIQTYGDLHTEFMKKEKPHLWFEVMQIISSFPRCWRMISQKSKVRPTQIENHIPIKENLWKESSSITLKEIIARIIQVNEIKDINLYIKNKHKLTVAPNRTDNPFITLRNSTKEEKLRNVQYKILHNIYPTMSHLHKWKLKESPNCHHCNVKETTSHAIYHCPIAKSLLENFEEILKDRYDIIVKLSEIDMIFGVSRSDYPTINIKLINQINTLLIIFKRKLILQRETKTHISINEINSIIENQKEIENYISRRK
jgi:hypothetical protein